MELVRKFYSKIYTFTYDALAIPCAWYLAYWFRYNLSETSANVSSLPIFKALAILFFVQNASYYLFKTYRGIWSFCSLNDVVRIMKSVLTSVIVVIPILYVLSLLQYVPRSVLPLYSIILIGILCLGRLSSRLYGDKRAQGKFIENRQRVLIVGAGQAGEGLVRDLKRGNTYFPIGFVDDKAGKRGMELHGVPVLGAIHELPNLVKVYGIDLIFIAIPSVRSVVMRNIVSYCEKSGAIFRTLPSLSALVSGNVEVKDLRPVNIEDLLGRDPVDLEWDKIVEGITQKRVVVTGAGGSIGSELCRQIAKLNPQELILIENNEFNLYQMEQEIRNKFPQITLFIHLMNIIDEVAVQHCFQKYKPHIVFHAAAFKHVPMLENQIRVATINNVLGTKIAALASVRAGVEKFILISTDKAVNPTNIMGTTKRVAEIYCQNLNLRVDTQFITVRFGNVLGSTGSVVPLFQKQLQAGGPLTVTHPDIERYFMTIPEACQLILQAMVNGMGGEIFVLDMGEPIKICYLAEQMIRLAGKEPGKDIAIEFTGLRPGEKLFEELFHESEQLAQTQHAKLLKAQFRKLEWQELEETITLIFKACESNQTDELEVLLKSLVPEANFGLKSFQLT